MEFDNYTVRQFMNAWFKQVYSSPKGIPKDIFQEVYNEYVDATKSFEIERFEKVTYVHFLNGRLNTMRITLRLQKEFLEEFGVPYVPQFTFLFEEYGYSLTWNGEKDDFLKQLERLEQEEKVYVSELETAIVDLKNMKKSETPSIETTRESFIKMINSLGKIGYKIDMDKTTVEELSFMINAENDAQVN